MDLLDDVPMTMSDIHNARGNELVRENLRRILARNAVRRGIRWISTHADNRGWWRNCLNTGKSRVRTSSTNEGILPLIFEYHPEFADITHYLNEGKIARHFGLSLHQMDMLGFSAGFMGWTPFPKRYPSIELTSKDIDRAWADFLENPPGDWLLPAKYWPAPNDSDGFGPLNEKGSVVGRFFRELLWQP